MLGRQALRAVSRLSGVRRVSQLLDGYGDHVFKGAVAEAYLMKQGLPAATMACSGWTRDSSVADKVAAAVLEWATENDATVFAHWFQPLGASGVRHGGTGLVHNSFFKSGHDGKPVFDLKGKDLLKGETDGSSYPNGGLRGTHRAGGYLAIDCTSPIFLRGDTIFIPSCLISYHGDALDEKTPLLRSVDAMDREGTRLLKLAGFGVAGLQSNIGLEQEFFFGAARHVRAPAGPAARGPHGRRRGCPSRPGDVRPLHGPAVFRDGGAAVHDGSAVAVLPPGHPAPHAPPRGRAGPVRIRAALRHGDDAGRPEHRRHADPGGDGGAVRPRRAAAGEAV
mmetsp:Transcript_10002/g.35258  ORF Transcript_10002/g.35258 Transcript_10002/m.35258 type:complete len:336 (+) Transcript_10002:63-1070(+)